VLAGTRGLVCNKR